MSGTARGIEDALQRVISLGGTDVDAPAHVVAGSRRLLVDELRRAGDSMTVEDLARASGLHVNTVRHHLDVLVAGGLVSRTSATPTGRGRPKVMYSTSATAEAAYESLGRQLDSALRLGTEDQVAAATARRWLESAPAPTAAATPDAAVDDAVTALRVVGFNARRDEIGDNVIVSDCPYASLIAEHPLICTVHAELVSNLLQRTGQPVELDAFDVWVRPGLCRARLRRPDVSPSFSVAPTPSDPPEEPR